MPPVFGVLFDGLAYGMLLFLMSVGLSVTLGMMNFVNLAHCSFAMLGGYVTVTLMNAFGWPFFATLPIAFSPPPRQASCSSACSSGDSITPANSISACSPSASCSSRSQRRPISTERTKQPVHLPAYLQGSISFMGLDFAVYRLFLIATALLITILLVITIESTRFGAQVRAAVNNQRMARGLGIDVDSLFAITFALGSGLAGLGGALAIAMVGLDPSFALTYLIYVLIVVSVGGLGSIAGIVRRRHAARGQRHGRQVLRPRAGFVPHLSGDDGDDHVAADRPVRETLGVTSRRSPARHDYLRAQTPLALERDRFLARHLAALRARAELSGAGEPDRDHGPVRAVARSHPRLLRNHIARPCRLFRRRRLYGGLVLHLGLGRTAVRAVDRGRSRPAFSAISRASSSRDSAIWR